MTALGNGKFRTAFRTAMEEGTNLTMDDLETTEGKWKDAYPDLYAWQVGAVCIAAQDGELMILDETATEEITALVGDATCWLLYGHNTPGVDGDANLILNPKLPFFEP